MGQADPLRGRRNRGRFCGQVTNLGDRLGASGAAIPISLYNIVLYSHLHGGHRNELRPVSRGSGLPFTRTPGVSFSRNCHDSRR